MAGGEHTWHRWEPAWHLLFYVCLTLSTAFTIAGGDQPAARQLAAVSLALLSAGWYGLFLANRGGRAAWLSPPVYVLGMLVLAASLLWLSPWYLLLLYALYPQVFTLLRNPWSFIGAAVLAVMSLGFRSSSFGSMSSILSLFGNVILAVIVGSFVSAIVRESEERYRAVGALSDANAQLAAALAENAELQEKALMRVKEAGAIGERQRLAREIHDTVAQGLVGIVTQLETAEHECGRPCAAQARIRVARQLARDSLAEARRSMQALRPSALDRTRLPEALSGLTERFSSIARFSASATVVGQPVSLPPEIEVTLFRVAQEALSNAARHAEADHVVLTMSYLQDEVVLYVRDNGKGFDRTLPSGGFGLSAMQERVADIGGALVVETGPENGTTVSASVPLVGAECQ